MSLGLRYGPANLVAACASSYLKPCQEDRGVALVFAVASRSSDLSFSHDKGVRIQEVLDWMIALKLPDKIMVLNVVQTGSLVGKMIDGHFREKMERSI